MSAELLKKYDTLVMNAWHDYLAKCKGEVPSISSTNKGYGMRISYTTVANWLASAGAFRKADIEAIIGTGKCEDVHKCLDQIPYINNYMITRGDSLILNELAQNSKYANCAESIIDLQNENTSIDELEHIVDEYLHNLIFNDVKIDETNIEQIRNVMMRVIRQRCLFHPFHYDPKCRIDFRTYEELKHMIDNILSDNELTKDAMKAWMASKAKKQTSIVPKTVLIRKLQQSTINEPTVAQLESQNKHDIEELQNLESRVTKLKNVINKRSSVIQMMKEYEELLHTTYN